jgi:hypothetical protein
MYSRVSYAYRQVLSNIDARFALIDAYIRTCTINLIEILFVLIAEKTVPMIGMRSIERKRSRLRAFVFVSSFSLLLSSLPPPGKASADESNDNYTCRETNQLCLNRTSNIARWLNAPFSIFYCQVCLFFYLMIK